MPTSPKSHKGPIAGTYTEVRKTAAERGYNHRWQKARATYLGRNQLCAACMKEGRPTLATVVDHIVPHRGDVNLFWDTSNWQPLCKTCHDAKTRQGQ